ncbi:MAG TPA: hypothetical protein VN281_19355 [Verrucomicrobiae bacterium]|nr:hypothetical protein [Verrucomicrobiae bacterium]
MRNRPEEISTEDKDLLVRAAAWDQCPALTDCTSLKLADVAQKQSLEFATAVLYDRLLRHPEHGAFFQRVRIQDNLRVDEPIRVGIIPGAFYREHQDTGADGARIATIVKSLNCPVGVVPVESFGSLARNASLIAEWLSQHRHERVIFISLSKGSADMKVALALRNATDLFGQVSAWISLSGLPQGTALVAWLRRQPLRRLGVRLLLRLRNQRYSVVEELRTEGDGPLAVWPSLPSRLRIIHVVGFPLRRHLAHRWAARGYERIAPLGPNDGGGFLLGDVTRLPGAVFPVWGADHYFQPAWDATPLLRRVLIEAMSPEIGMRQATHSAAQPISPPANRSSA